MCEGPLVVILSSCEALLELFGGIGARKELGVWAGEVRRAGAEGLVDDVDFVAEGEEVGCPAGAIIWCIEEVLILSVRSWF